MRVGEEPPADAQGVLTVKFRLPDGTELVRRFNGDGTMEILFDYLEGTNDFEGVKLLSTFPRQQFTREESKDLPLSEFGSKALLIVESD